MAFCGGAQNDFLFTRSAWKRKRVKTFAFSVLLVVFFLCACSAVSFLCLRVCTHTDRQTHARTQYKVVIYLQPPLRANNNNNKRWTEESQFQVTSWRDNICSSISSSCLQSVSKLSREKEFSAQQTKGQKKRRIFFLFFPKRQSHLSRFYFLFFACFWKETTRYMALRFYCCVEDEERGRVRSF